MNILILCTIVGLLTIVDAMEFVLTNAEDEPIWVGTQGSRGNPPLDKGGIELQPLETRTILSPDDWSGRFWARTWCSNETYNCLTGDCGDKFQCDGKGPTAPATIVEINLRGRKRQNYYLVKLTRGYNLAISIEPINGKSTGGPNECKKAQCIYFLGHCPENFVVDTPLGVGGCVTACNQFQTDEYCCRGRYGYKGYCKSSYWPVNYNEIDKNDCPNAHTYAIEDNMIIYNCVASKYKITFGGPN